jgi:hypothetical protein
MAIIKNKKYRAKLEKNKNDYLAGKLTWTEFIKKTKSNRATLKR